MLLSEWLEDWLVLRSLDVRPRTLESYQDLCARYIVPSLGSVELSELNGVKIGRLLASIVAEGHTRTAELVYVLLRSALSEFEPSPMRGVRRPAHVQRTPEAWTDEEMRLYVRALAGHRHQLALSLALFLGLRRGEVCGLRWQDVDLPGRRIHICNQRQRMQDGRIIDCPPKSASSDRVIPIPDALLPLLFQAQRAEGYLCALTPSGLDAAHRTLVRSLRLPYIPLHGLRHTMATACIRHGGDMRSLQNILGHASYTTTAHRYTHPDEVMLKCALDVVGGVCYTQLAAKFSLTLNQGVQGSSP